MESATETRAASVAREIVIEASPETVWDFLVEPAKMSRWMGMRAVLERRVGGAYRCEVIPGHTAAGEVVEIDPPRRLVFTWGWEGADSGPDAVAPGASTVEIELVPHDQGTILRFLHRDLPSTGAADSHAHGWTHYLGRLGAVASGGDPGEDPWLSNPPM